MISPKIVIAALLSLLVLSPVTAQFAAQVVNSVAVSGITGLGTGVATALGIAVGSAGGPVTNGGALGTPSSGAATNLTSIPVANATGILPVANGGAGAINGALKGNGSGAVSQAACTDISNASGLCSASYVAPTSWTPADGSGASLAFTGVSANYTRIGNMVFAYAQLTYPATADGSVAFISGAPVSSANANYAKQCNLSTASTSTIGHMAMTANSTVIQPFLAGGGGVTNLQLSGVTLNFICIYPVS